jgi:uncharacterized protein (DUF1330 family)
MRTYLTVTAAMAAGMAIGGFAVQSLQAQSKKVYTVTELQTLDAKLAAEVAPRVSKAQEAAGGVPFKTGGGKITAMEGTAPDRVAITEWPSLDKAEGFFKSKAWADLGPERDKALKTLRRYAVEER